MILRTTLISLSLLIILGALVRSSSSRSSMKEPFVLTAVLLKVEGDSKLLGRGGAQWWGRKLEEGEETS